MLKYSIHLSPVVSLKEENSTMVVVLQYNEMLFTAIVHKHPLRKIVAVGTFIEKRNI